MTVQSTEKLAMVLDHRVSSPDQQIASPGTWQLIIPLSLDF